MKKYYYGNYVELGMTIKQANSVAGRGEQKENCEALVKNRDIRQQLDKMSDENIAKELSEYGAWSEEELKNRKDNELRLVWIMGCNISEDNIK